MPALRLPPPPWIVGHRGAPRAAPENSVASVLEAAAQGADMAEIDLQLTRDDELVVHHDLSVRVSAEETRPVGAASLAEIRHYRHHWRNEGGAVEYGIATLEEVLAAVPELPLNLELKRYDRRVGPARMVDALAAALRGRRQILVSSFDWPLLAAVRRRMPRTPLALLAGRRAEWPEVVERARRLDAFSIHLHRHLAASLGRGGELDRPDAEERPLLAYTVNRLAEARGLLDRGLAGLITDRPGEMRRGLARRG